MGRKAIDKNRKIINKKVTRWLEVLLLNLQDKNLEKLTIDDIALIAGKSKSTIYIYFKSKEEILLAACKTRVDFLAKIISDTYQQELDTEKLYVSLMQEFAKGSSGISIYFLQNIKKSYPASWAIIEEFTDNFIDLIKQQYKLGIKEGVFNDISIELASQLDKIFIMQVVTNTQLFNDKTYTVSQLINQYLNLRLTGLLKR